MAEGDFTASFRDKANYMKNWKPASAPSVCATNLCYIMPSCGGKCVHLLEHNTK